MRYKITKIDKRHNGYSFYKYFLSPITHDRIQSAEELVALRNWCWETYGPSAELGWTRRGDKWAWETEHGKKRIYLNGDPELMLFKLKFS